MLNWLARYAPLRDVILDDAGQPRASLLDVGCGPHGLACAFPDVPFTGTDVLFPSQVAPTMVGVRSRPGPLPFADGAFGTVLCLDVLEHVPGPERAGFVAELARVAAERVILACPSDEAQGIDDFLRMLVGAHTMPAWLAEHYECGLPTASEIASCADVAGYTARPLPTSNGLLAMLVALGDMLPATGHTAALEFRHHRQEWVDLFATTTFGDSPRKAWMIERVEARTPLVGPGCHRDEVAAALRCPTCGEAHRDLRCLGCGRQVTTDATGAWDLATVASATRLDTDAHTILWMTPEWDEPASWTPVLKAYIELSAPEDDCCLVLCAPEVPGVADAVARACDEFAAGQRFGDILLADASVVRPLRAQSVASHTEIAAALGAVHPGG